MQTTLLVIPWPTLPLDSNDLRKSCLPSLSPFAPRKDRSVAFRSAKVLLFAERKATLTNHECAAKDRILRSMSRCKTNVPTIHVDALISQ